MKEEKKEEHHWRSWTAGPTRYYKTTGVEMKFVKFAWLGPKRMRSYLVDMNRALIPCSAN